MNNRQFWFSIIFFVPHLYSAETMWVVLPGILAGKFNDLVFEDIPVLWYPVFFHCPVSGIDLLAGDKEHAFICPSCKLGIVGVPHVYGQD